MAVRVGINGFGRIGRLVFRAAMEAKRKDIEFVAINDLGTAEANAHLLKYDSVHGTYPGKIEAGKDHIKVDGKKVKVLSERDPAKLPWGKLGVDVVLECTGIFATKEAASKHLEGGAKKVLVSAPASGADITVVYGINHDQMKKSQTVLPSGPYPGKIGAGKDHIKVDGKKVKGLAERDPAKLPWGKLGVDVVLECTGIVATKEAASKHLEGGAKKVLVSAPASGADITVVYGINHDQMKKSHTVVSNASCTTNCLVPVAHVLEQTVGIKHGLITTVHPYTGGQPGVDTLPLTENVPVGKKGVRTCKYRWRPY